MAQDDAENHYIAARVSWVAYERIGPSDDQLVIFPYGWLERKESAECAEAAYANTGTEVCKDTSDEEDTCRADLLDRGKVFRNGGSSDWEQQRQNLLCYWAGSKLTGTNHSNLASSCDHDWNLHVTIFKSH